MKTFVAISVLLFSTGVLRAEDATLQSVKDALSKVSENLDTLESEIDFKGSTENQLTYSQQSRAVTRAVRDLETLIKKYDSSEQLESILIEAETLQVAIQSYIQNERHGFDYVIRPDEVNLDIEVGGVLEKIIKKAGLGVVFTGSGSIRVSNAQTKWNQLGKLIAEFRVRMQRIKDIDAQNSRFQSMKDWGYNKNVKSSDDPFDRNVQRVEILPFGF